MKKLAIIAITAICSFNVFAEQVLVESIAKSVESSTKNPVHKEARECTYSLVKGVNGLALYLSADEDSGISINSYVDKVKLPLQQGDNPSGWNNVKIVRKGSIVTITEKKEAPAFGSIYDVVTLDASADLKVVKSAKYENFITNLVGIKKLHEQLSCEF